MDLSAKEITDETLPQVIDVLKTMPNLVLLDISDNAITDPAPFSELINLTIKGIGGLKLQVEQEEPAELPAELMTDLANVGDLFAAADYSSGVDKPFVPMEEGGSMDFMAGEFDMEFPQ